MAKIIRRIRRVVSGQLPTFAARQGQGGIEIARAADIPDADELGQFDPNAVGAGSVVTIPVAGGTPTPPGAPIALTRAAYDAALAAGTLVQGAVYVVTETDGAVAYYLIETGGPTPIGGDDLTPGLSLTAPVITQLADETVIVSQPGTASVDPEYGMFVRGEHVLMQGVLPVAEDTDLPWLPPVSADGTDLYGLYLATIETIDGRLVTASIAGPSITVTVTDTSPPVIAGPEAGSVMENTTAIGTYTFDRLVNVSVIGPDAALISVPTGPQLSAAVSFKVAPDFEAPADDGANNDYDYTIVATDAANAGLVGTLSVRINVVDVAEPPVVLEHAELIGGINVGDKLTRRIATFGGTLPHTFEFEHIRTDTLMPRTQEGLRTGDVLIVGPNAPPTYTRVAADALKYVHRRVKCIGPTGLYAISVSSGNGPGAAIVTPPAPSIDPDAGPEANWLTPATFPAALASATAGQKLVLVPGENFGRIDINNRQFATDLIIMGADTVNLPRFTAQAAAPGLTHIPAIQLRGGTTGVHLKNIQAEMTPTATTIHSDKVIHAIGSSRLTFTNVCSKSGNGLNQGLSPLIQSRFAFGFPTGYLLYIENGSDIKVLGGVSQDGYYGVNFAGINGLECRGREFVGINCDPINSTRILDARIVENYIHDSKRSTYEDADGTYLHADAIQVFQSKSIAGSVSRRVAIQRNVIDSRAGTYNQSIIVGEERWSDTGLASDRNEDFLIEENYAYNGHAIGAQVFGVNRLTIRKNTFLRNPFNVDPAASIPRLWIERCNDAVATLNISATPTFSGNTGTSSISGTVVATPGAVADNSGGNYASLFISPVGSSRTRAQMAAIVGGSIYAAGAGAQYTRPNDPAPDLTGLLPWETVPPVEPTFPAVISILDLAQSEPARTTETSGLHTLARPIVPYDNRFRFYHHQGSGNAEGGSVVQALTKVYLTEANKGDFTPSMVALAVWCQFLSPTTVVHFGEAQEAGTSWIDLFDENNSEREAKDTWDVANALYADAGKIDRAHAYWMASDKGRLPEWLALMGPPWFRQSNGIPPQSVTLPYTYTAGSSSRTMHRTIYNFNATDPADRGTPLNPDNGGVSEQALLGRNVPFDLSRMPSWAPFAGTTDAQTMKYIDGYHAFIKDSRYQSLGAAYGPPGTGWSQVNDNKHPDADRYEGVMLATYRFYAPTIKRALGLKAEESAFTRSYTTPDGLYTYVYSDNKNGGVLETTRRKLGWAAPASADQSGWYQEVADFYVQRLVGGALTWARVYKTGLAAVDANLRGTVTRHDANRVRIAWEVPVGADETVRVCYSRSPQLPSSRAYAATVTVPAGTSNRSYLDQAIEHVAAHSDMTALYPYCGDLLREHFDDFEVRRGYTTYTTSNDQGTGTRTPPAATLGEPPLVGTPDTTPPTILNAVPADNAVGVSATANIVITFNETIQRGTGAIILRQNVSGSWSDAETFDAATSTRLTISGAMLTIDPTATLVASREYAVRMAAGSIRDIAATPNPYAGITNDTTLSFTVAAAGGDTTPPVVTSTSPADNATGVAVAANGVLTFDEAIQRGTSGSPIILRQNVGGTWSDAETFAFDSTRLTFSGSTLTIDPTSNYVEGREYAIRGGSGGTVRNAAGLAWAGIADDTTFSFTAAPLTTTDPIAPVVVGEYVATNGGQSGGNRFEGLGSFIPVSGKEYVLVIGINSGNQTNNADQVTVRRGAAGRAFGVGTPLARLVASGGSTTATAFIHTNRAEAAFYSLAGFVAGETLSFETADTTAIRSMCAQILELDNTTGAAREVAASGATSGTSGSGPLTSTATNSLLLWVLVKIDGSDAAAVTVGAGPVVLTNKSTSPSKSATTDAAMVVGYRLSGAPGAQTFPWTSPVSSANVSIRVEIPKA